VATTYVLLRSDEQPQEAIQGAFTELTSQAGEELYPSLSPDGDFVVYMSENSGNWDIYLQRVGGQKAINLSEDSPDDDRTPAFSPDGQQIAFRSEREGGGIFVMGATGESVRRITDFGYHPAWSPDGKSLVFAEEGFPDPLNRGGISQLWTVDLATGETQLISEGDAVQPNWSPGGHRIAYWAVPEGGQRDILTMPAEGGEPIRVTNDPHLDWNPVWSPDGAHLYFLSDRGGSMNLWRVPIDEASGRPLGEPEPFTAPSSYAAHLTISTNGGRMAYASWVGTSNLQKVGFDPTEEEILGPRIPITQGSRIYGLGDASPDGAWLTFSTWETQEDIFVARTDGTGLRQLTNDVHKDRMPRWSPHGKRIAFYSDRSGSYELWAIRPDGSGLQQLTDAPEMDLLYTVWAPDGSRMATMDSNTGIAYTFDPNTTWKDQVPEALPRPKDEGDIFDPVAWSPDGKRLAGGLLSAGGTYELSIFSLESQTYERWEGPLSQACWLQDSRRILSANEGKLFLLDTRSNEPRELLATPEGSITWVSLSPDNRTIYFSLETEEADIWLVDLK
jgi:tricorn protease